MFVDNSYDPPLGVLYTSNLFCSGDTFSPETCSATGSSTCPTNALGLTCYITGKLDVSFKCINLSWSDFS